MNEDKIFVPDNNLPIEVKIDSVGSVPENIQTATSAGKVSHRWLVFLLVIVFGVATGFFLSGSKSGNLSTKAKIVQTSKEQGSTDIKTFPDTASGTIQKNPGTVSQEGTHMLVRNAANLSQTAFLTSSVVDLDQFIGKKVEVWGKTFKGSQAAWLMDIGRVKVSE